MVQDLLAEVKNECTNLIKAYDWQLIEDVDRFCTEALNELIDNQTGRAAVPRKASKRPDDEARNIREILWAKYFALICQGLQHQHERASEELEKHVTSRIQSEQKLGESEKADLVQEVLASLVSAAPRIKEPRGFSKYVALTLTRAKIKCINKKQEILDADMSIPLNERPGVSTFEDDIATRELGQQLADLINTHITHPLHRRVVYRFLIYEETAKEIAEALNMPSATISVAKHRGLEQLKKVPAVQDILKALRNEFPE